MDTAIKMTFTNQEEFLDVRMGIELTVPIWETSMAAVYEERDTVLAHDIAQKRPRHRPEAVPLLFHAIKKKWTGILKLKGNLLTVF